MRAVGDDCMIGADVTGECDCVGIAVHHDQCRRRHRSEHLDSDVAETAGTDHHAHIAGAKSLAVFATAWYAVSPASRAQPRRRLE